MYKLTIIEQDHLVLKKCWIKVKFLPVGFASGAIIGENAGRSIGSSDRMGRCYDGNCVEDIVARSSL